MTFVWIILAAAILVGIPAVLFFAACVAGSQADQCEALYVKKKQCQPASIPAGD